MLDKDKIIINKNVDREQMWITLTEDIPVLKTKLLKIKTT